MEALFFSPDGASADPAVGDLPDLPIPVVYPQYSTLALLPLEPPLYKTQVCVYHSGHGAIIVGITSSTFQNSPANST